MATVTEIQDQLDSQGTAKKIRIVRKQTVSGTVDNFYCTGGVTFPGRARWCSTTTSDTAAQQATAITTAMA